MYNESDQIMAKVGKLLQTPANTRKLAESQARLDACFKVI
jgi:hypothetical protein